MGDNYNIRLRRKNDTHEIIFTNNNNENYYQMQTLIKSFLKILNNFK